MALISPVPQSTVIKLYHNIPWSNDYSDIRWFRSTGARDSYFNGQLTSTWTNCSVVKNGMTIKLQGQINDYLRCNYLSFVNNGIGTTNITYYAFITNMRYISVNAFEVDYEIDWVQTYLFDIRIGTAFVEREHVSSDAKGEHRVEESLDTGEFILANKGQWTDNAGAVLTVLEDNVQVSNVNNVLTCLTTKGVTINGNLGSLSQLLQRYNDTPERIISLSMCSGSMVPDLLGNAHNFERTVTAPQAPTRFAYQGKTYTPVNNKLYTYPYMFMTIDNYGGMTQTYRYEDFSSGYTETPNFTFRGSPVPKPCLQLVPASYKGLSNCEQYDVRYDNFPMCPYAIDTYRAWLSQYATSYLLHQVSDIASSAASGVAALASEDRDIGKGISGIANAGIGIYDTVKEYKNRELHGVKMQGSIGSAGIDFNLNHIGFRYTIYTITPEYAKKIDSYLTRYGYQVNEVKVPNVTGRRYFNYVRAKDAIVYGDVPEDTINILSAALSRGCTFWHVNNIGGTYSDNPIG